MTSPRRIVITGVSRGLGRALTEEFVRLGGHVFGAARSADAVAELRRSFPAPHRFEQVDVRDDRQTADWARSVISRAGPPDLLLNNAAVINANAVLWEISAEEFSDVVDANLKGVFHVLRHFLPAMVARRAGTVVNFSSGWGRSTSPEVAPYCATKWAIEGLTQALAAELPAGMAAVPLNPGIIHTQMLESCFGDDARAYPSPADWAKKTAPFLLELGPRHNGRPLTAPT